MNPDLANVERAGDATMEALAGALRLKDPELVTHSMRVTAFSVAIAKRMAIATDQIRTIARAAYMHDLGKMSIPDSILRKPGALTKDEAEILKEHVVRGVSILRKVPFLHEAAAIVFAHHEHFDGTGYPQGLIGEEIPLAARVVTAADALDNLTCGNRNAAAQTAAAVRAEIKTQSGRRLDPAVVGTVLGLPDSVWEQMARDIAHYF